jgi:Spy/CpxP family protein refolding chaperone
MIKKHIAILGAAVALFAATEATAQAPAQPDSARQQGELRRRDRQRGGRGMKMRRAGVKGLFRDIDLTPAQRDQMKTVNEKYRTQFKALHESVKPDMQAVREARQRGDTAAARAAWDRTSATRDKARTLHEQQRGEIRALLTAEQRTTFDKNALEMKERIGKHRGRRGR